MNIKNVTRNIEFEASIADNLLSQTKGLSFSKPRNVLFKFPMNNYWGFWMFGVPYTIDIAFIDEQGEVFQVEKAIPLTLHPKSWKSYKPKKPCKFVLETPRETVSVGDKLKW